MTTASTFTAIVLAIAGGVLYHVSAKSVPRDLAPALVLVTAYTTALAVSVLAYLSMPHAGASATSRVLHPAVVGLGLGAALIEVGFVLTYRAAWPVSTTSVVVNGVVAAILVPVGLLAFGEQLSAGRITGLLLCLGGVWLLRH